MTWASMPHGIPFTSGKQYLSLASPLGEFETGAVAVRFVSPIHCQLIEGDEVYTRVAKNRPAHESPGWTIVLMERASRFIWALSCGEKDAALFKTAMQQLAEVIAQTGDVSLLTDGERRYGNLLFAICQEVARDGRGGDVLPQRVVVVHHIENAIVAVARANVGNVIHGVYRAADRTTQTKDETHSDLLGYRAKFSTDGTDLTETIRSIR